MTLTWMDHAINKGLDLLMFLSIPFVVWLFRNRIRGWFKGNDKKKYKNSEGMKGITDEYLEEVKK